MNMQRHFHHKPPQTRRKRTIYLYCELEVRYPSKSTNQFGERKERLPDLCFSICRFSQVVFIPRVQPHAQSLFLFPIVFGINLIHFFDEKKESWTVQPEIRSFVPVLRSPVTPLDRSTTKNANCFKERNVFGNGKCELSALQEGRN